MPENWPKALDEITKKLLVQNNEECTMISSAHVCHGFEHLQYLFENLSLVTPERGEMPLRIFPCEEIPCDLI